MPIAIPESAVDAAKKPTAMVSNPTALAEDPCAMEWLPAATAFAPIAMLRKLSPFAVSVDPPPAVYPLSGWLPGEPETHVALGVCSAKAEKGSRQAKPTAMMVFFHDCS